MGQLEVCPSCRCTYRVPPEFKGHTIACKQCGTSFSLTLAAESGPIDQDITAPHLQTEIEEISQDDSYLLIGKLAVKYNFASVTQIKQALAYKQHQKQAGRDLLLGEILVAQKIISQSQLDFLHSLQKLLNTRASDNQFAVIAVKNDFATQAEIDAALLEQKKRFQASKTIASIESILVESGVLSAEQRDAILIRQRSIDKGSGAESNITKGSDADDPVDLDALCELSISQDKLRAFISPKENLPESVTVVSIKNFLKNKGIIYGLADDNQIAAFLKNPGEYQEPWKIAEGEPPEPGREARLTYYFDTDPLKTETIKADGTIDFKDTGNPVRVKKGALVAEKIPAVPGSPGMDVYGRPAPSANLDNTKLRAGKGTTISEDGLKVFAETEGVPRVSVLGKVYVLPQHNISGDVGLRTGHVDFEGDIRVAGSIQNGYHVKGHNLLADEILKARIEADGDVIALNGIIGATINAGGNVRATFVRHADIKAFGDVIVKKGIRDSHIETGGACIIKGGTILSSTIVAQKGIWATQIGSDVSKPCTLTVGIDVRAKNETDKLMVLISVKKQQLDKIKSLKPKLDQKSKQTENKVGELAQMLDRAMVKQRQIQSAIKELQKTDDKYRLASAETTLQKMDAEIKEMESDMEKHFDLQDRIVEKIEENDQTIENFEIEIVALEERITEITEWASNVNKISEIRVKESIFPDTTIDGTHSSLALKQIYNNVLIKEFETQSADDMHKWQMKISPLQ